MTNNSCNLDQIVINNYPFEKIESVNFCRITKWKPVENPPRRIPNVHRRQKLVDSHQRQESVERYFSQSKKHIETFDKRNSRSDSSH